MSTLHGLQKLLIFKSDVLSLSAISSNFQAKWNVPLPFNLKLCPCLKSQNGPYIKEVSETCSVLNCETNSGILEP